MKSVKEYAIDLLVDGAISYAEDDIDEEGELLNADDLRAAIRLTIDIAYAIRANPQTVLALVGR